MSDSLSNTVNDLADGAKKAVNDASKAATDATVDAANTVAFLNLTALVRPFNLSGHPAITIPYETAQGLPVGLQLVTKHNADEQLCAIAKYISDATKSAQGARS